MNRVCVLKATDLGLGSLHRVKAAYVGVNDYINPRATSGTTCEELNRKSVVDHWPYVPLAGNAAELSHVVLFL